MSENPRYFVTVHAVDRAALRKLADFDLDLFQATARVSTDPETGSERPHIEGLMTLDVVGRLVEAGYRVTVEATQASRSRAALGVVEARSFLDSMGL